MKGDNILRVYFLVIIDLEILKALLTKCQGVIKSLIVFLRWTSK